jgi:hypothetical protein
VGQQQQERIKIAADDFREVKEYGRITEFPVLPTVKRKRSNVVYLMKSEQHAARQTNSKK